MLSNSSSSTKSSSNNNQDEIKYSAPASAKSSKPNTLTIHDDDENSRNFALGMATHDYTNMIKQPCMEGSQSVAKKQPIKASHLRR